jgi:7-cyano-7-deazaguanine reductase
MAAKLFQEPLAPWGVAIVTVECFFVPHLVFVTTSSTQRPSYGERHIAAAELICFDNPQQTRPYDIEISLPEFTCKCPFSGYPDFAKLQLSYQPGPKVLELKALKLYVNSWRDCIISHEEVVNRILDDFVAAATPNWMELVADFNPRGNVHTVITVRHGLRQP